MNQFFVEPSAIGNGKIIISGNDVKHIQGVLRLRAGEEIQAVCPADGLTYYCTIEAMDKTAVTCIIQDVQSETTELPVNITLYQGLPKGDKFEFVIQKAVELGAVRIVPVAMKRSVMKIAKERAGNKLTRWNTISASAASQSKRRLIPEVSPVISFWEAVREAAEMDAALLPYELAEGMEETRDIMEDIRGLVYQAGSDADKTLEPAEPTKTDRTEKKDEKDNASIGGAGQKPTIAVFVGPEGGFEAEEVEEAKVAGAKIITLGRRILRTETAPIAILSWLTFLFDV